MPWDLDCTLLASGESRTSMFRRTLVSFPATARSVTNSLGRMFSNTSTPRTAPRVREDLQQRREQLVRGQWVVYEGKHLPPELRGGGPGRAAGNAPDFRDPREVRDFVEMQILEGMRNGAFRNLKNKGKPLSVDDATAHPDGLGDTAMRIMKENNVKPPWIELMNSIDGTKRKFREWFRKEWETAQRQAESSASDAPSSQHSWRQAITAAEARITELNRRIDDFNVRRPERMLMIHRFRLRLEDEIRRAQKQREPVRSGSRPD